ncbi:MAG: dethiobiotin synthase [Alphaproteobacteria bacterium]
MKNGYIITGTDTDIGKTVFAAMLMLAFDAIYWKPLQSGTENGGDRQAVQRLTGLPASRFHPERYIFMQPLSPHRAAEIDGVEIDADSIVVPEAHSPLLIEGAGGLMVPVTRQHLQIDLFKRWDLPVILCSRTALGTINHTLLSIEALRKRDIPVHGIAFIGPDNPDNIRTIAEYSGVSILGRLPHLETLNAESLKRAFAENFDRQDF